MMKPQRKLDPELGGFTEVARHLGLLRNGEPYRQQVYNWYLRRRTNGFPEPTKITPSRRLQFNLDEVQRWYAQYQPSTGGRRQEPRGDVR